MLNRDLIERKCKLILEDLEHLRSFAKLPIDEVTRDLVKMSVVERLLEKIITRAIDANRHLMAELGTGAEKARSYEDTFLALGELGVLDQELARQIAPSAGLRNRLVHEYNDTDPRMIFASASDALDQYVRYCRALLSFAETIEDGNKR